MLELPRREGRLGNQWVNQRPSGEEVAAWFADAVRLHDGMDHDDFVSGITLIQETVAQDEIVGFADDGRPNIVPDVTNVFFTPYAKVETRVDYFHKWMALHQDWLGIIEPVPAADPSGMTIGFNAMKIALPDGKVSTLICCTMQVRIVKREGAEQVRDTDADGVERLHWRGETVLEAPTGTKSVPMLDRYGRVDVNAVAKAQTGAVGRALGMAGVLIIPGTGVATAEDMQEALSQGQAPGAPAETAPTPVEAGDPDVAMRATAASLIQELQSDFPEDLKTFQAWAREREFKTLKEIGGPALKGVVRKLEKTLIEARGRASSGGGEGSDGIDLSGNQGD